MILFIKYFLISWSHLPSNDPFSSFLIINFSWHLASKQKSLLEKGEMMKKITMFVAGIVFIMVLVSFISYQSLEPKNVFAEDVEVDQMIRSAYIDGFIDALMLGKDQIQKLQHNRPAIKREAIMAADVYCNELKKQKQ